MTVLQTVAAERCTALYGVPTMFIAELDVAGFGDIDLTSLRTGIMAGAPCPIEVMQRVMSEMHMTDVAICYGMTERVRSVSRPLSTRRSSSVSARSVGSCRTCRRVS